MREAEREEERLRTKNTTQKWLACLLCALILVAGISLAFRLLEFGYHRPDRLGSDFKGVCYLVMTLLQEGKDPFDQASLMNLRHQVGDSAQHVDHRYPGALAPLFFLSLFPVKTATLLFLSISAGSFLAFCFWMYRRSVSRNNPLVGLSMTLMALIAFPTFLALSLGNFAAFVSGLLALAASRLEKKGFKSDLLLGLSVTYLTCFKSQFFLLFGYLFLARRFRALGGGLLALAICQLLNPIYGYPFLKLVNDNVVMEKILQFHAIRGVSLFGGLQRLFDSSGVFQPILNRPDWIFPLFYGAAGLVGVVTLGVLWGSRRLKLGTPLDLAFVTVGLSLLPPHHEVYDLLPILFCAYLWLEEAIQREFSWLAAALFVSALVGMYVDWGFLTNNLVWGGGLIPGWIQSPELIGRILIWILLGGMLLKIKETPLASSLVANK